MGVDTKDSCERRAAVVKAAVDGGLLPGAQGLSDEDFLACDVQAKPLGVFYDGDMWAQNLALLRHEFGGSGQGEGHFLHACAVKTNPLGWFLKNAREHGHGAECASLSEVVHALDLGFAPNDVVFDSPCKTHGEIKFALEQGVHLNMDNLQELVRVERFLKLESQGKFVRKAKGPIGIRINPLVGAGTIAAFSVSTGKSKFGVPLPKEGEERIALLETVVERPWITCVHVHTGSGGMGLDQLVMGVRTAVDFALEINQAAGRRQITTLDMGGGLAVDYRSENPFSGFAAYAEALRSAVPELFEKGIFDRVVSEFGAALQCKFAFLASRVEYTKSYDGGRIALMHAGSDIFMRACYCPETFVHHRVFAFDSAGSPKRCSEEDLMEHDVAGPLCFAGDVVVRGARLAPLQEDDIVVLADTGGNSLSLRTSHCSRQAPPVYVYTINQDGQVQFQTIRSIQPVGQTLEQWKEK